MIPSTFWAKTTLSWRFTLDSYPVGTGWIPTVRLGQNGALANIVATESGVEYLASRAAADTAWAPAIYPVVITVAKAGEVQAAWSGSISVISWETSSAELTARRAELVSLDATIAALLADGLKRGKIQTTVSDREWEREQMREWRIHRAWLVGEIARLEAIAAGKRPVGWRRIQSKFS